MKPQIDTEVLSEYLKCREDPIYFINKYAKDYTQSGTPPLVLYPKQEHIIKTIHNDHFVILMGSRQCGKTISIVWYIVWLILMFPKYTVAILSRKGDFTNQLVYEIRVALETLPEPFNVDFADSKKVEKKIESLIRLRNGSSVVAITVPKDNPSEAGRGLRAGFVFIDEAAFVVNLDKILSGITHTTNRVFLRCKEQGLPYGIVLSSTPNGMVGVGKTFYDLWTAAEQGLSRFKPITFYWYEVPEYTQEWYEEQCKAHSRRDIAQELDLIFLGAEDSFLDDNLLVEVQSYKEERAKVQTRRYVYKAIGDLEIYEEPKEGHRYIIGIDPSTGVGDCMSFVCVVDMETNEQVAEFAGKSTISFLCKTVLEEFVLMYKNCVIVAESNGVGNQVIEYCLEREDLRSKLFYHFNRKKEKQYGLVTTAESRQQLFTCVYEVVSTNLRAIKSVKLLSQIVSLRNKNGRIYGTPDDGVFAFGFTQLVQKHHLPTLLRILEGTNKVSKEDLKVVTDLFVERYGGSVSTTIPLQNDDLFSQFVEFIGTRNAS